MMTKSYIEIKVPFAYNDGSFEQLRLQLRDLPVRWQRGFYHITLAFIDDTRSVEDIKSIVCRNFVNVHPIKITFDKFDVFEAHSGMQIIYLTASHIPEELRLVVGRIRKEIADSGSLMQSDFNLHVTLGRVMDRKIELDKLRRLVGSIKIPPFAVPLDEVEYRYFRGETIKKISLK